LPIVLKDYSNSKLDLLNTQTWHIQNRSYLTEKPKQVFISVEELALIVFVHSCKSAISQRLI